MKMLKDEKDFQNWLAKVFFPKALGPEFARVVMLRDRISNGYPDMLVLIERTNQRGMVVAVEVKYRNKPYKRGKFLTHKLSALQKEFLCEWGLVNQGCSFVIIGYQHKDRLEVCTNEMLLIPSVNLEEADINELRFDQLRDHADRDEFHLVGDDLVNDKKLDKARKFVVPFFWRR